MSMHSKILLIDDDEAVLACLSVKLSRRYEVICTTEPHLAVAMARRERPDLILCDIDMPGLAGGEVAAALAADPSTAAIPLVYVTGLVSPDEARELHGQIGGRPGVSKRAPLGELVGLIEKKTATAPH